MPESQLVKCKVIIKHQPAYIKAGRYGITVTRSGPPHTPGAERMLQISDDEALFATLLDLGYSAPEIAHITQQLEPQGADYIDHNRLIAEATFGKYAL